MQDNTLYPLISVAIPVYNSGIYLRKCLDSVINQSYTNIEILIVNNGSTDDSANIIKEYQILDNRIKVVSIQHVNTVNESRNNCFINCKSDWIIPIDSDDYIEQDYVEKLWNRHLETKADFVGSCMVHLDVDNNIYLKVPSDEFDYNQILSGRNALDLTLPYWKIAMNGALMNKNIIPACINNDAKANYTDECDQRLYLINAKRVAFKDAHYNYNYNPNSTGKKESLIKLTYGMLTGLGLLVNISNKYSKKSLEYKKATKFCVLQLSCIYEIYVEANNYLDKQELKQYLHIARKLYSQIQFNKYDSNFFKSLMKKIRVLEQFILISLFK